MFPTLTLLPRLKLTEKICEALLASKLTVVIAPMGYGKTTLANSLTMPPGMHCWYYAVPTGPHDAHFLWHDMCESLAVQGMTKAPDMRKVGFPESASQIRRVVTYLQDSDAPSLLMLDDYHFVTDTGMSAFWENVVRMDIPDFHLVLFSRTRPAINLEELRIKRQVTVFEQDALAFSKDEVRDYFKLNGIDDQESAAQAWHYSEGWPAALWLCLQSRQNGGQFSAASDIESLLANTIFSNYSSEERDFLMRLSVFERFTEQEASKIAGLTKISIRLRRLRDINAFLSFNAKTGHYHFHSIFRDFLHKELATAPDIDKSSLYRLAGECYAERGEFVSAFRLFFQAGRDEDLTRLLDLFLCMEEDTSSVYFVEELFQKTRAVPERILLRNPIGYLCFVVSISVMWPDHRTASFVDEAEDLFLSSTEIPEYLKTRIRGEIESVRGVLVFSDMDRMWSHYAEACRLLDGPSFLHSRVSASATNFGNPSMAFTLLREEGDYASLVEKMERNIHLLHMLSDGMGQGLEKLFRAEYLMECGNLAGAEAIVQEVLRDTGGSNDYKLMAVVLTASFSLARIYAASGRPEEAVSILDQLPSRVESLNIEHRDCVDLSIGYINAVLGRLNAIPQWLREGEIFEPPHCYLPQVLTFSLAVYAKSLLLSGDYQKIAVAVSQINTCSTQVESLHARIHRLILQGIAAWHTQGRSLALARLKEALHLSRPDGIVLPLAEYGRHIIPLLRFLKKQTVQVDLHLDAVLTLAGYIAQVDRKAAGRQKKGLLTVREQEIMRYATFGQSNPAIAENLGISSDAVKKILSRAYIKLGVAGRVEAVQRFGEIYGKDAIS